MEKFQEKSWQTAFLVLVVTFACEKDRDGILSTDLHAPFTLVRRRTFYNAKDDSQAGLKGGILAASLGNSRLFFDTFWRPHSSRFWTYRRAGYASFKALIGLSVAVLNVVHAATWILTSSTAVRAPNNGARYYINNGGKIQELYTLATSTNPLSFDTWANSTQDFTPYGVSNVAPLSDITAVSYLFNGATKTRVFYQTTDRSIHVMMCCQTPEWAVDPTVIAVAPLGVNIDAFEASDTNGTAIVVVSWQNNLGQLTQRWATDVNDVSATWSAPIIIST
ncbi:hypothetical protein C8R45DRAFT_926080 [Mycena sanguinolenta]|nr:hypothetical protein C8R45DRAFT_926080 [Mycena sanguinolenta]